MLTIDPDERINITGICSHWWVNEFEDVDCLENAEMLANKAPVRLDELLSVAANQIDSEHMVVDAEASTPKVSNGTNNMIVNREKHDSNTIQ